MNVARLPEELEPARRAVAIGTFDGVHIGHRRVIEAARAAGLRSTVVTFDPHPRAILGNRVELLTTTRRRLELFEELGVEDVLLLRFDAALAALAPEAFAASVLGAIGAEVVTAGDGFRFGHGRSGDLELLADAGIEDALVLDFDAELAELSAEAFAETILRRMGAEIAAAGDGFRFGRGRAGDLDLLARLGFDVRPVPLVENVSSSRIRALLAAGEVGAAATLLGRPPEVEGTVVHGDHRGAALGFPTANLDVPAGLLVPALGIYAGEADGLRAAVSIGTNPHYGGGGRRVEAFLLDYDGDLYGKRLVLQLWEKLRDEAAFESETDLVEAIAEDVRRTRAARRPA